MAPVESQSVEEIFEQLRDFKNLTRERALEALREALAAGRFARESIEPLILSCLGEASWEARQSGLAAAAEAVKAWDSPGFRESLLREVPRLLVDPEYRVRKAMALVLRECCVRDGIQVFDGLAETVLGDIRDKFRRKTGVEDGAPGDATAPPTFLPDTEGWRSLETSMGALEAMMQGCGAAFTPRIDSAMIDLLAECSKHTNRFVREYAFFAFKNAFEVCEHEVFLAAVAPRTVDVIAAGIADNWSQVRYAGSTAARAFMEKAGEEKSRFFPQLLGLMCLNRHYVAEGVRLYSQDTWRIVCGPQGGARLLVAHFDSVIDAYVRAAEAPNHAVREAGCHCIAELAGRVAGTPQEPTPYREAFTPPRIQRLLETLLVSFQDESWPVRDVASTAVGKFVVAFPTECLPFRAKLVDLWFDQMADNIPSLRQNAASGLASAVGVWTEDLWDEVLATLKSTLPSVLQQPENSQIFTDYTPSGPFSVPRTKPASLEDKVDPAFANQTMYSCGSAAPKTFKRRSRVKDSGCMNCSNDQPKQLWEASEGMIYLLVELASLLAKDPSPPAQARKDGLAALLPSLVSAFECSQYRHHHLLKQRTCERLPVLTQSLGFEAVKPEFPALLRVTGECAAQGSHHALQESARELLSAWQRWVPAGELEAACDAAGVDVKLVACE